MPLYNTCCGQLSPHEQVIALGLAHENSVSQVVLFDEVHNRFDPLLAIPNSQNAIDKLKQKIEQKRANLEEFS